MYFMVEKGSTVTKFIDGHACHGGQIYDSENMRFNMSCNKTRIEDDVLKKFATKWKDIRLFEKENETEIVEDVLTLVGEGKIKPSNMWDGYFQQYKKYRKSIGDPLKIEEKKGESKK